MVFRVSLTVPPTISSRWPEFSLSSMRMTLLNGFVVSSILVVLFGLYSGLAITVLTDRGHPIKKFSKDNLRYHENSSLLKKAGYADQGNE